VLVLGLGLSVVLEALMVRRCLATDRCWCNSTVCVAVGACTLLWHLDNNLNMVVVQLNKGAALLLPLCHQTGRLCWARVACCVGCCALMTPITVGTQALLF
jgi:hypothetical protein